MSKRVLKYRLSDSICPQELELPVGAKIVHFGIQSRDLSFCVWAEVSDFNESYDTETRIVHVAATGQETGEEFEHVGSLQSNGYVWHLFEVK